MSEVQSLGNSVGAPFVDGRLRPGDSLLGFRDSGLRGVNVDLAEKALIAGYEDEWREVDLTDDDERVWKLGELVVDETASLDIAFDVLERSSEEEKPEVHALLEMSDGFTREMQRMLARTGLGVEITASYSSQLMRLIQFFADNRRPVRDSFMYENFTMAHGPVIVTPEPRKLLSAGGPKGQPLGKIGEIIDRPVIRIHSQGTEQPGSVIARPVLEPR